MLASCVDGGKYHLISCRECLGEGSHKIACARVEMWMKGDNNSLARKFLSRRFDRLCDRRRMMCVVVEYERATLRLALIFKAPPRTLEMCERIINGALFQRGERNPRRGGRGAGIIAIEFADQTKCRKILLCEIIYTR